MPTAEHTKLSAIKHRCRAGRATRKRARPAFLCPRPDPVRGFFSRSIVLLSPSEERTGSHETFRGPYQRAGIPESTYSYGQFEPPKSNWRFEIPCANHDSVSCTNLPTFICNTLIYSICRSPWSLANRTLIYRDVSEREMERTDVRNTVLNCLCEMCVFH